MQRQMLGMRIEKSGLAIRLCIHQEHLRTQLLGIPQSSSLSFHLQQFHSLLTLMMAGLNGFHHLFLFEGENNIKKIKMG